ncbi:MAG: hypothetical protein FJZ89_02300 [Chloroflexi bacterium]|nr:hypothetical protein [Chloroflexota bacterium]
MNDKSFNAPQREMIARPQSPDLPFSTAIAYGNLVYVLGIVGRNLISSPDKPKTNRSHLKLDEVHDDV